MILCLHEVPPEETRGFWKDFDFLQYRPTEVDKANRNFGKLLHQISGYKLEAEIMGNIMSVAEFLEISDLLDIEWRTEEEIWADIEAPRRQIEREYSTNSPTVLSA